MRPISLVFLLAGALGCATDRAAEAAPAPAPAPGTVLRAAELARVRCLLVAPLENGTDAPLAADAATGALLSAVDGSRTKVFPVPELRALFRDTPLELPQGIAPSLALELAELVGADAALWGSVEGRASEGAELVVTLRLSLVGDHQLLFADTALVKLGPGDRPEAVVRRVVLQVARPMLARLGDAGRKRCFDAERSRALRRLAVAEAAESRPAPAAQPVLAAARPPAPAPVVQPAAAAPGAEARTPRQADWAKRLGERGRFMVEDVAFPTRTAEPKADAGIADLAVALLVKPSVAVRVEGFVDATSDRAADAKLSQAMAQGVVKRLVELGVARGRLTAAGRAGDSPILPNFTARGRAANRRVEVVALP